MPKNLYRRGKTWWGRVQVAGREHRKSLRTRDRAVAKMRFEDWHDAIVGEVHFGEHRPSWDEALLRYVQDVMPEQVKASTAERYLTSFRQVHHLLTGKYLDKIGKKELFVRGRQSQGPEKCDQAQGLHSGGRCLECSHELGVVGNKSCSDI